MAAALDGLLVAADGCLWIRHQDWRYLVVWPSSYDVRPIGGLIRILDREGSIVASQGAPLVLEGGEVSSTWDEAQAAVLELTGTTIPAACETNLVWNANSVIPPE